MTTTQVEATQFFKILLDWCSPQVARSMLDDMDFYIADTTDNESIRDSIKMVRRTLYEMAEENLMVDEETEAWKQAEAKAIIAEQRRLGKDE
tara:strand:- start:255 stop:530 length:276 start_codon:yes stop_codon:yes gene_type:complete